MPAPKVQSSFAAGVLSPSLHARIDLAKFDSGAKTLENFVVHPHGGASNRAGLQYVARAKGTAVRLLPFEFSTQQTYILEFGEYYMRVIKEGGLVTETDVNISGATQANPVVISATAHGYSNGDWVYISGVVGMTRLNNRFFKVANQTANTFEITDVDGTNIDGTGFAAYSSGGTAAKVYEVVSPYAAADLAALSVTQSADTLYLAHTGYAPRSLTRTGHTAWTFTELTFAPSLAHPAGASASAGAGGETHKWQVTAMLAETFEESLPAAAVTPATISGATAANPVVITATAHGFSDGDKILIESVAGMTELNDRRFVVANKTANTFELNGEDGSAYSAYSSGGAASLVEIILTSAAALSTSATATLTWTAPAGDIEKYNVYREKNGIYGFVGSTEDTSYEDDGVVADLFDTPPKARNPFRLAGDYPGTVALHEQRAVWGASTNDPQKVWMSQSANFLNMNVSTPSKADDAVTFTIAAKQVNAIKHYLTLDDLIILTGGGEWKVNGGEEAAITPSNVNVKPQSYRGSGNVPPLVIGSTALYVQKAGKLVRDLGYQLEKDGYGGNELSILAAHLFKETTIAEWDYAQNPDSIVWCVLADGTAAAMTYLREHEVWAWTTHSTDGSYESVAVITEGNEDVPYFVVKRTINSIEMRFIERLHTRIFSTIEDAFFVDNGLSYDGSDATVISGLDHLEGESVAVLADGNVIPGMTVTDGAITLPNAAAKVHVGMPYSATLESLPLGGVTAQAGAGRRMKISRVQLRVENARGIFAGPNTGELTEWKQRAGEVYGDPTALETGTAEMTVLPSWSYDTTLVVRQTDPLPVTVLGMTAEVNVGG
ncbi:MAG: hypothetical protein HOI02_17475 [Rhodospirillaceae bacterium]|jgi:hypothetical protein|nr:hypothetical protein [Rhodospirillaceae bacterium]